MAKEWSVVEAVAESWGIKAEPIQTSDKDESDWLIELEGCRVLIEEKQKFENPVRAQAREAALTGGRAHGETTPLSYDNTISGIVRKAARQLSSTSKDVAHELRIVWFTGMGFDAEAKHHQFMATLYGSTKIIEVGRKGLRDCYFYRNAEFLRHRDVLDGAVSAFFVSETLTMFLCLNSLSANYEKLRDSQLARRFPKGLTDPIAEERAGTAFIVDADVPRGDAGAVLTHLQQKYKLGRITNMDMNMTTATVAPQ